MHSIFLVRNNATTLFVMWPFWHTYPFFSFFPAFLLPFEVQFIHNIILVPGCFSTNVISVKFLQIKSLVVRTSQIMGIIPPYAHCLLVAYLFHASPCTQALRSLLKCCLYDHRFQTCEQPAQGSAMGSTFFSMATWPLVRL